MPVEMLLLESKDVRIGDRVVSASSSFVLPPMVEVIDLWEGKATTSCGAILWSGETYLVARPK